MCLNELANWRFLQEKAQRNVTITRRSNRENKSSVKFGPQVSKRAPESKTQEKNK